MSLRGGTYREQRSDTGGMACREVHADYRAVRCPDEARSLPEVERGKECCEGICLVGRIQRLIDRSVGADPVDREYLVAIVGKGVSLSLPPAGLCELGGRENMAIGGDATGDHDERCPGIPGKFVPQRNRHFRAVTQTQRQWQLATHRSSAECRHGFIAVRNFAVLNATSIRQRHRYPTSLSSEACGVTDSQGFTF